MICHFKVIQRKIFQICQGKIAGSEIINGDFYPAVFQAVQMANYGIGFFNDGAFGQLCTKTVERQVYGY